MTLFQNDEFFNKPQYRDLFMIGDECLVKGIRFFGTPFFGVSQANLSVPLVRAVQGPNMFTATIGKYLGSLKETYQTDDQSIEVLTFLQRFSYLS